MMGNWIRSLWKQPKAPRRPKHGLRGLQVLEARDVPATIYAYATADGAANSLRQAIITANATPEADTIWLMPGTYNLTRVGAGENAAATGDLDLTGPITIRGYGAGATRINASALGDRVFHNLGQSVTLSDITITGGRADRGGGILSEGGSLTLNRVVIDNNLANGSQAQGGGVLQVGGRVDVNLGTFTSNKAMGSGLSQGGGLALSGATANIRDTTFGANQVVGGAGGVAAGGAIDAVNGSQLNMLRAYIYSNRVTGGLGAVNSVAGGSAQGGGVRVSDSTAIVSGSYFWDNRAIGGMGVTGGASGDAMGGALMNQSSTVTIGASQFFSNQAVGGSMATGVTGGSGMGGALYSSPAGNLTVLQSNLWSNRADGATGHGGGAYLAGTGTASFQGSYVRYNTAKTSGPDFFGPYTST